MKIRPKAVVLTGPTAVGKTAMTEALFSHGFEIINADSVQIYRGLDIGSAKPDKALMGKIPHHLIDIKDPWEDYSSGDFVHDAEDAMSSIWSRGNIPLITGGTMYYIKHLVYGAPSTPAADASIRKAVRDEIDDKGLEWAFSYLQDIDPVSASRIGRNDDYRISRAIEVFRMSGKPLSSFPLPDAVRDDISFTLICLKRSREELKERIGLRVEQMFSEGLYDEIRSLARSGADLSWPAVEGIGYREFFQARIDGEESLSMIKERIIRDSFRYAKQQMTFASSMKDFVFIDPDDAASALDQLSLNGICL